MNVEEKIKSIIEKNMPCPIPKLVIDDNTDLIGDVGFDSISFFAFLLDLEKEFGINFLCFEIESLVFKEIKKIVEDKLQK